MRRILAAALLLGLLAPARVPADFYSDVCPLLWDTKTPARALPAGATSTNYFLASEVNAAQSAAIILCAKMRAVEARIAALDGGVSQVATPTFSPPGGPYSSAQNVTASSSTAGATLYTGQSNPPTTASASFTASSSGTWYAQAKKGGMADSAVASATYTIGGGATGSWVTAAGAPCTNSPGTACEWQPCKDDPLPSTVFYVCDTGGDDSRTAAQAQSPSTPWKTRGKAVAYFSSSLQPGQAIAFCRGGTFACDASGNACGLWQNNSGSASSPFIVRDYTRPGRTGLGDPRPIFTGKLDDYITPGNVTFENITVQAGSGLDGAFIYKTTNNIKLCNLEFLGGGIGVHTGNDGDPREVANLSVIGSRFVNNANQGFLGAGPNLLVDHNYFAGTPTSNDAADHAIYVAGDSLDHADWIIYGETISNNEIHPPPHAAEGQLVMHGIHVNVSVTGNTVINDTGTLANGGGWGLAIGGNGYAPRLEYIDNAVMRGNTVINMGNVSLAMASCKTSCRFENNLVVNTQQATVGIAAGREQGLNSNPNSGTYLVRSNTVYASASGSIGIDAGAYSVTPTVENNVVQAPTCYAWSAPSFGARDYNASATTCTDAVVGAHSWKADPRWVNPTDALATMSFRPNASASSPLIGAGDSAQNPGVDLAGATRPSAPSIGAYEP